MELKPEQIKAIAEQVGATMDERVKKVAGEAAAAALTKNTEAIVARIDALKAEMTEAVGAVSTRVDEVAKGAPKGRSDKGDADADADVAKRITDAVQAAIGPLAEKVQSFEKSVASERERAAVESVVDATIKKRAPNLSDAQRAALRRTMLDAAPKDEAAAAAALDATRDEWKALGFDVKPFTSTPGVEGADAPPADAKKTDLMNKLDKSTAGL